MGGGQLSDLEHFIAYDAQADKIHVKPLPNILVINTNNTGTTIYKRIDNSDGNELITLENGENTFTDWNYGFKSYGGMKQYQITSFDLSNYNTFNVTKMSSMFSGCTNLISLDLSKFDTSNVTEMSSMFSVCRSLTSLNLSSFDTSNVTEMGSMFNFCPGLTSLNLSSFDTSNVTDMSNMFSNCSGLTSLDLSNFNTSNVTSMQLMFNGCNKLTHIKCKQSFKDWCITNQNLIKLPTAMRNGGNGNWEIVDYQA